MADRPIILRAKYAYKPANNDELKLEKGDLITLTQKEEGGWWEGTLNGRTGWFPSNYVMEHNSTPPISTALSAEDVQQARSSSSSMNCSPNKNTNSQKLSTMSTSSSSNSSLVLDAPAKKSPSDDVANANTTSPSFLSNSRSGVTSEEQVQYRRMILTDLIDSEAAHISELQSIWDNILQHLPKAGILTPTEFKILVGNLTEIIQVLTLCILGPLKNEQCKPVAEQRIGKIFLDNAPKVEAAHKTYCSNHPKAVQIIERFKEQLGAFVEGRENAKPPGVMHLLTVLSQPFRRLEKYPLILLELERYIEEFHKDRGDLQRSIEYYKNLDKSCIDLRKQKEMELEVLSGAIIGWEGSDITKLGDIVHMNLVHLGDSNEPRYFVLFTNTLLILSYDLEKSSLTYEGKIPVSGITLTQLTNKERYKHISNGFEIAGPMIDPIAVSCPSKPAKEAWIHQINRILKTSRYPSFGSSPQQSFGQLTPPVQGWNVSRLRPAPPYNPFLAECLALGTKNENSNNNGKTGLSNGKPNVPNSNSSTITAYPQLTHEEDFTLLSIVDSFANKNRQISASQLSTNTSVNSVCGNNKPSAANGIGNSNHCKTPRTIAEHVHSLHDEVAGLKSSISTLVSQLNEEQNARKSLQSLVQSIVTRNGISTSNASTSISTNNYGLKDPEPVASVPASASAVQSLQPQTAVAASLVVPGVPAPCD